MVRNKHSNGFSRYIRNQEGVKEDVSDYLRTAEGILPIKSTGYSGLDKLICGKFSWSTYIRWVWSGDITDRRGAGRKRRELAFCGPDGRSMGLHLPDGFEWFTYERGEYYLKYTGSFKQEELQDEASEPQPEPSSDVFGDGFVF